MLQTPVLKGLSFDPFPFQQDGVTAPEVDIGGREVIQALVVAPVVVVLDEDAELGFEITRQIIVLQQDPVLDIYEQRKNKKHAVRAAQAIQRLSLRPRSPAFDSRNNGGNQKL